jgi:hypothetical protein
MDDFPTRSSRRNTPTEDFTGWPAAALDDSEWAINCGNEACGAFLADAAWIDVQMAMIMNSNDEFAARAAADGLPPTYRRQFRMNVQFSPDWAKSAGDVWSVGGAPAGGSRGAKASEQYTQRYIRGILRQAELNLEAQPPAKVVCPACATLQVIPRHYRKGVPQAVTSAAS